MLGGRLGHSVTVLAISPGSCKPAQSQLFTSSPNLFLALPIPENRTSSTQLLRPKLSPIRLCSLLVQAGCLLMAQRSEYPRPFGSASTVACASEWSELTHHFISHLLPGSSQARCITHGSALITSWEALFLKAPICWCPVPLAAVTAVPGPVSQLMPKRTHHLALLGHLLDVCNDFLLLSL